MPLCTDAHPGSYDCVLDVWLSLSRNCYSSWPAPLYNLGFRSGSWLPWANDAACSALCGLPLPAPANKWSRSAASRHTIAPVSHTRSSSSSSQTTFLVSLRSEDRRLSCSWAKSVLENDSGERRTPDLSVLPLDHDIVVYYHQLCVISFPHFACFWYNQ